MRPAALILGVLAGLAAVLVVRTRQADAAGLVAAIGDEFDSAAGTARDWIDNARGAEIDPAEANLAAFLVLIRTGEGTADADGYRRMFGGKLFSGWADHPRIANAATLGGRRIVSTAAGAYQFLAKTWDEARAALALPDFSPASQDIAAAWLIRRRGALSDVRAGRLDAAIAKCAKEWASLPGSPYGQPTITAARAREVFAAAGGVEVIA